MTIDSDEHVPRGGGTWPRTSAAGAVIVLAVTGALAAATIFGGTRRA